MHLQPTSLRQRFGLLLALVLSLNFIFGVALTVEAAPPVDLRGPAARHSRDHGSALAFRGGRTIGPAPAQVVAPTGETLAPAAEPATPVLAPAAEPVAPALAPAAEPAPVQSEFEAFVASVTDGGAGVLRGVYVPGVLALRVVHQPAGVPFAVSLKPGTTTLFGAAAAYGVTGLLADNIASGVLFYGLAPGQTVTLVNGDGATRRYTVNAIYSYQALSPTDPYSNFVDLSTGAQLSAIDLFNRMYTGGDKVTFQTCLARDGVLAWGRFFVTATPAQ
jgi:hypothetical protein